MKKAKKPALRKKAASDKTPKAKAKAIYSEPNLKYHGNLRTLSMMS